MLRKRFGTVINCMDGRTQVPVIRHLQQRWDVAYVDTVTEPGPVRILAEQAPPQTLASLFHRVDISVHHHRSVGLAVVAHEDCAGNPVPRDVQIQQLRKAWRILRDRYPQHEVVLLWVDAHQRVEEIPPDPAGDPSTRS